MYIPDLKSIENAIRIYYQYPELNNARILDLFEKMSNSTLQKMKKPVKEMMIRNDIKTFKRNSLNTKVAYETWGIDIDDLEVRNKKLKML